ncbi:hypothetical protein, partial [Alkalihalophilus pseudofirmus]|uniref:hypothetical protein n=1 Tax=Alkalihalophilus pseudofirmus TaxID=79885 RepID=UPI0034DF4477
MSDNHKVKLASFKLEGDAYRWWDSWKTANGGDDFVDILTWVNFKVNFLQHYFPPSVKAAYVRDFANIRQKDD